MISEIPSLRFILILSNLDDFLQLNSPGSMMPPIDLGYDFLCFLYTLIVWYIILLYKRLWLRDHGYNVSLKELWHSL